MGVFGSFAQQNCRRHPKNKSGGGIFDAAAAFVLGQGDFLRKITLPS